MSDTGFSPVIYSRLQRTFRDCLRITNESHFTGLRDMLNVNPCLATLTTTDKKNCRTPLYQALFDELSNGEITPLNAKNYARNLARIFDVLREQYGERTLSTVTNMINHAYPMHNGQRIKCETIRDLLEDEKRLGEHFTGVLDKYGLLSRDEVTRETLPFAERISAKALESSLRPFR